jgi:hypothetical protein
MDWVVAPVDQWFPIALLEVSVTLSPIQKVVGPLEVMVGVGGSGLTVTTTGIEAKEGQTPSLITTV